jgi:hypothetical protein
MCVKVLNNSMMSYFKSQILFHGLHVAKELVEYLLDFAIMS